MKVGRKLGVNHELENIMPFDPSTVITLVLLACLLCSCETAGTHLAQSESAETSQDILISEILASNTSTNFDPDHSAFSDWIEIRNAGEQAIDLQGFFLTDDLETPTKWQIAVSTVVPAAGFVLIWADGRNENLHTNFSLSQLGEEVGLFDPNGDFVDAVRFSGQISDVSLGRRSDKQSGWVYFSPPSPNAANNEQGIRAKIRTTQPRFSVPSGFYDESQDLVLSTPLALSAVTIRYTLDGATPTNASPVYTSPIHIDSTTVVRARTFLAGYLPSTVASHTYLINEEVTLPTISIMTEPGYLWDAETGIYVMEDVERRKDWERAVYLEFFESDKQWAFGTDVSIRLFGRTAIELPQKSLSVFIRDETDSIQYRLFSGEQTEEFRSFLLRSSSDDWDKTMFRDAMAQRILDGYLDLGTQRYRPAVLFLSGEYVGIHNIREKHNEFFLATRYDIDLNGIDLLNVFIETALGETYIEVLYGESNDYQAVLDFIGSHDMRQAENYAYVQSQIDIDNLIDYMIAEIYTGNESWNRNRKVWRDNTTFEKWRFLVYDLDRGFGDPETNWLKIIASFDLSLRALLENTEFQETFVRRFSNALNTAFEPERIIDIIDELQAGIASEMPRHIARWKDECKESSVCGISSMEAWYDQVELMREFARQRPAYVWQHLADRFGASGTVELVLNLQESEGGTVFVNDLQVTEDHFTYTSLADIPLQLEAVPNKGYRFLGWQGIDQDGESISPVLTTDCTITAMFAPVEHSNARYSHNLLAGLLVLALGVGLFRYMCRRRAGPRGGFKI
jgi:hypothetical protein